MSPFSKRPSAFPTLTPALSRPSGRGSFLPLHRNGGEGRGEGVVELRNCHELLKSADFSA